MKKTYRSNIVIVLLFFFFTFCSTNVFSFYNQSQYKKLVERQSNGRVFNALNKCLIHWDVLFKAERKKIKELLRMSGYFKSESSLAFEHCDLHWGSFNYFYSWRDSNENTFFISNFFKVFNLEKKYQIHRLNSKVFTNYVSKILSGGLKESYSAIQPTFGSCYFISLNDYLGNNIIKEAALLNPTSADNSIFNLTHDLVNEYLKITCNQISSSNKKIQDCNDQNDNFIEDEELEIEDL